MNVAVLWSLAAYLQLNPSDDPVLLKALFLSHPNHCYECSEVKIWRELWKLFERVAAIMVGRNHPHFRRLMSLSGMTMDSCASSLEDLQYTFWFREVPARLVE